MKPKTITTIANFPDYSWEFILLFAVGMVLDGSLSKEWLVRELAIIEEKNEVKDTENKEKQDDK